MEKLKGSQSDPHRSRSLRNSLKHTLFSQWQVGKYKLRRSLGACLSGRWFWDIENKTVSKLKRYSLQWKLIKYLAKKMSFFFFKWLSRIIALANYVEDILMPAQAWALFRWTPIQSTVSWIICTMDFKDFVLNGNVQDGVLWEINDCAAVQAAKLWRSLFSHWENVVCKWTSHCDKGSPKIQLQHSEQT